MCHVAASPVTLAQDPVFPDKGIAPLEPEQLSFERKFIGHAHPYHASNRQHRP